MYCTKRYIDKYGGASVAYCKEVGMWSHSALDGPKGAIRASVDPIVNWEDQMQLSGWSKIIFNPLADETKFVMYGCNSAAAYDSFAQKLSLLPNFKDIEVWGQPSSSFPSKFPDYRRTSVARSVEEHLPIYGFEIGYTYMVAGGEGKGLEAQTLNFVHDYPAANPMNCYKNGLKIRSTHQGYFNDHRIAETFILK